MRLSNSFGFTLFLLLLREKHEVFLLICLFLLITKVFLKFKRILFGKNIRWCTFNGLWVLNHSLLFFWRTTFTKHQLSRRRLEYVELWNNTKSLYFKVSDKEKRKKNAGETKEYPLRKYSEYVDYAICWLAKVDKCATHTGKMWFPNSAVCICW